MGIVYNGYGKIILAGEHSVLRGCQAIVVPLQEFSLSLEVIPSENFTINTDLDDSLVDVLQNLIINSLHLNAAPIVISGEFLLYGNLPLGKGLGFSAALCWLVAQWCCDYLGSSISPLILAKQLEDVFHGKSSGVDIVGTAANKAKLFNSIEEYNDLSIQWQPKLYLSLGEGLTSTKACVRKVTKVMKENVDFYKRVDNKMQYAVDLAKQALATDKQNSLQQLVKAINLAQTCFDSWRLVDLAATEEINRLYLAGALAVKLTGSGGSGCILSVWDKVPKLDDLVAVKLPVSNS